jgi:hypothetical protein
MPDRSESITMKHLLAFLMVVSWSKASWAECETFDKDMKRSTARVGDARCISERRRLKMYECLSLTRTRNREGHDRKELDTCMREFMPAASMTRFWYCIDSVTRHAMTCFDRAYLPDQKRRPWGVHSKIQR